MASHPIVHIEIPADSPEAAGKFYADVFGWGIEHDPAYDYTMFRAEGGPGGAFVKPSEGGEGMVAYQSDRPLIYIGTDDVDATLASIVANGGQVLVPKTEIPSIGWFAIFKDPAGNRMAVYKGMGRQGA